ncbi:MAG: UDP-N-acetylglucosamine:LPS N-acetylglucosamine transferase [Candidatus Magasanikbacteria bacterium GW2011_GWA2_40_10]|uniref:UDP-N-acetylglucosamine:LPS N-acetylglucosamine transferase n=1 Tax=Candidatus Magasanikbacteria bacterium GW2011_GWA2_40_10 TaxID=1619037 RepID=A0A0G0TAL9_9BACT|nr:MAG: UDP-N-acetylglucosamine:LPS N-acetylglucosamine transferase [Candidatus Magasanikbacteria bacterium GW2011_GWA2_40_10]
MSKTKKLLIISCSTGSGHFRAAESIRLTCQKLYPDAQVLHIDMADYLNGVSHIYVVWLYSFLSANIPIAYKLIYHATDNSLIIKLFRLFAPIIRMGSKKFIKRINDYRPDLIISTHFLPPLILPKKFSAPISMVITDYHAHRVWLAPNVKTFFVATDEMKNDLEKLNIKSVVSGIPIHPHFFKEKNVNELKKELNIENDWPIILIMPIFFGSIIAKEAITTIFSYNKKINVVAITGKNNEKVFNDMETIKDSGQKNFTIIKITSHIDGWMRIADIIVSKAGGLTISEVMYLQKPLIVVNPIPGQEDYNTAYLEKNNYCLRANSSDDLAKKIKLLLSNPKLIEKKSHPNASEIILKKIFD